jgi:thioredoxin reductase (NADPH)
MTFKNRFIFMSIIVLFVFGLWILFKKITHGPHGMGSGPEITIVADKLSSVQNLVPVAVIGSGPAGLSAALYAARMNLYTVVFKGGLPGGQLMGTSTVENWPGVGAMLGPDIMKQMEKHVERFGVQFSVDSIEKVDFSTWPYVLKTDEGTDIHALTVIIATGSTPLRMNCPGEEEYWGRGVSTCAVCDAPFYKNRDVVVVGGGDSAAEAALQLAVASRHVTMLVRGDAMRASTVMQQRLHEYQNIEIKFNTKITKINGDGNHVKHVDILTKKHPSTITTDAVFISIGHTPNSDLFKQYIKLDDHGYILPAVPGTQQTSLPGIFVAGDVADYRYRQAGVAAGDGIKAGLDAIAFLRDRGFTEVVDKQLDRNYFDVGRGAVHVKLPIVTSKSTYQTEIKGEKRPIVLDFYAPYCASCMRMIPIFESAAAKLGTQLKFIKVDVSKSKELSNLFDVPMIPTILVIKNGKLLSRSTEVMGKRQMVSYLSQFIDQK